MWTDEQLAQKERAASDAAGGTANNTEDLYRLARLGLAAEAVKDLLSAEQEGLNANEFDALVKFFKHPAWRAE